MDRAASHVGSPYVDSHAHFLDSSVEHASEIVSRAEREGLARILAPAIDLQNCETVLQVAALHEIVFAAVGIHPNSVAAGDDIDGLRHIAARPGVKAIAETGLDYYRTHTLPALQRERLAEHYEIASEYGLPIILHNRNADADIIAIASSFRGRVTGVLHCFSSAIETAEAFIEMGYFISFAGNLTYPGASEIRDVASRLTVRHVLTETDAPYLAPVPFRGKRNEPANVTYTAAVLATCLRLPLTELLSAVEANAAELFRW